MSVSLVMSSASNLSSVDLKFSTTLVRFTVFGITIVPRWRANDMHTCKIAKHNIIMLMLVCFLFFLSQNLSRCCLAFLSNLFDHWVFHYNWITIRYTLSTRGSNWSIGHDQYPYPREIMKSLDELAQLLLH